MQTSGVTKGSSFASVAPKLGHQPAFDGIRGIGVILVLIGHASVATFSSFAAIVDVFFVVSGFLITTLLLEEDRRHGSVSMRNFYKRRAMRLLPMLYIVLGVTLLGVFIIMKIYGPGAKAGLPDTQTMGQLWSNTKADVAAGGLYMYHVFFPVNTEVVTGVTEVRPLNPLWSLSVEEHYYVFGVLLTVWAVKKHFVRQLMVAFFAAWVFIGVARALGHVGPQLAWYQRPDAILIGVVLAFVNAHLPDISPRWRTYLHRAGWAAGVVFVFTIFLGTKFAKPFGLYVPYGPKSGGSLSDGLYWGRFGFTICSAAMSVLVLAIVRIPDFRIARFLTWGPATKVGHRSYSLYLIHVPLLTLLVNLFVHNVAIALILMLPLLVITSELAHRYVEKPMMRAKSKSAPEPVVDLTTTPAGATDGDGTGAVPVESAAAAAAEVVEAPAGGEGAAPS